MDFITRLLATLIIKPGSCSSVGRASVLLSEGCWFDSPGMHVDDTESQIAPDVLITAECKLLWTKASVNVRYQQKWDYQKYGEQEGGNRDIWLKVMNLSLYCLVSVQETCSVNWKTFWRLFFYFLHYTKVLREGIHLSDTRQSSYLNEWEQSQNFTCIGHQDIKTACIEPPVTSD